MTEPAIIKTIEHGEASPLPENNWLWRRVYVFVVTAALCAHVGWLTWNSHDIAMLRNTVFWDQCLLVLFALLYLAGASAEAITRLLAAVRTTRKETVTSAPPPATLVAGGAGAQTSVTTAEPDAPPWAR